jgi:hypothetical protein
MVGLLRSGGRIDEFMRQKLDDPKVPEIPVGADVFDYLDKTYGDQCVVVLDQFEELIRFNPDLYNEVATWILEANQKCRVKIVLSLRLEYRHMLRHLDHNAAPFSMTSITLEPLFEDRHIDDIISSRKARTSDAIDEVAANRLAALWKAEPEARRLERAVSVCFTCRPCFMYFIRRHKAERSKSRTLMGSA